MEKVDSLYFWRKGVLPYRADNFADYLDNRDVVTHRRNGILTVVPQLTIEAIPEEISLDEALEQLKERGFDAEIEQIERMNSSDLHVYGYSKAKLHDRLNDLSDDAFFMPYFHEEHIQPHIRDSQPGAVIVTTLHDVVLQYRKGSEISTVHGAIRFTGEERPSLLDSVKEIMNGGSLAPVSAPTRYAETQQVNYHP